MKKVFAIFIQVLIFIAAWFVMSPDALEDNTHLFGLFGNIEIIRGNTDWVMLTAAILSVFNIWVWWPSSRVTIPRESIPASKSVETDKEINQDKTPS